MTTSRFYHPASLQPGKTIDLPETQAHHACRVLRLRKGDGLTLFDGRGGEYRGRIVAAGRTGVVVELLEWLDRECESRLPIILVQALQAGDKMDATIQKAVELGVVRIVPVRSRRSVVRLSGDRAARRVAHWRSIALAACEQCGRNRLPIVDEIIDLDAWLALSPATLGTPALRLCLLPEAEAVLSGLLPPVPGMSVELLIGAEGGLSAEEIALAVRAGFRAVRLGPRVLRTETAGMAAVSAIQALWGDFA